MKKITPTLAFVIFVSIVMYHATPCFGQMRSGSMGMKGRHRPFNYELVSKYVANEIDMKSVDSKWHSISGVPVRLTPMGTPELMGVHNTVELKSVHTDKNIYIWATWPDRTESINKKMWIKRKDGSWMRSTDDEDRIGFIWEIDNSMVGFSRGRGRLALCHPDPQNPRKDVMSTKYTGGRADIWHWKAARTNPVGFSDDQYLDKKGRKSDSGESAYKDNKDKSGYVPAFMFASDKTTSPFLLASKAKPFDNGRFKSGDTLPSYILKAPTGDRADIKVYGIYKNGYWTVVFKRSLNTGHAMDVRFEPGKEYNFAAAVFDNAGDEHHLKSHLIRLFLEKVSR